MLPTQADITDRATHFLYSNFRGMTVESTRALLQQALRMLDSLPSTDIGMKFRLELLVSNAQPRQELLPEDSGRHGSLATPQGQAVSLAGSQG